ncbi:retrovirus-related pol polyprotein from transposon TNT 1-94 [Tanacetum coccineum]
MIKLFRTILLGLPETSMPPVDSVKPLREICQNVGNRIVQDAVQRSGCIRCEDWVILLGTTQSDQGEGMLLIFRLSVELLKRQIRNPTPNKHRHRDTTTDNAPSMIQTDQLSVEKLSTEKSTVSSLLEEKKLKSDFKIREDELLDKQIQLENKIKELDNILLRAQLFDKVSDQVDTTKGTSTNTKFANHKVDETNDLSKPVTSNSVPTPQESKIVKHDNVIAPGMFRINPFKPSREEKYVPNKVRASVRTTPITVSQPHVVTKKDVNSDSIGFILLPGHPGIESQPDCSNGDNACTVYPSWNLKIKRSPTSTYSFGSLWEHVRFGNDHVAAILGFGDLQWGNILITRLLQKEETLVLSDPLEGVDLLKGNRSTNLYTINLHEMASASPICLMARATSTKSWLWHQRLSHLNFDTINDYLPKTILSAGLPNFNIIKDHLCTSCEQEKAIGVSPTQTSSKFKQKNDREDIGKLGAKENAPAAQATSSSSDQRQTTTTADSQHTTTTADTAPTPTNSSSQAKKFPNTLQDVDELETQQQHVQHQPATIADNVPNAMFDENTFVNPFATPSTSAVESSSSQYVVPSNIHTFYQLYPYEYQWTKDHPLE